MIALPDLISRYIGSGASKLENRWLVHRPYDCSQIHQRGSRCNTPVNISGEIFFGVALCAALVMNYLMSTPCQHCGYSDGQRDIYHPKFEQCVKCGKNWLFKDLWKCGSCGFRVNYRSPQPYNCSRCGESETMLRNLGPNYALCGLLGSAVGAGCVVYRLANPMPGFEADTPSGMFVTFVVPFFVVFFTCLFRLDRCEKTFRMY